jgi:hypothetical protein
MLKAAIIALAIYKNGIIEMPFFRFIQKPVVRAFTLQNFYSLSS